MIARALAALAIGTMAGMISHDAAAGVRKGYAAHYPKNLMERVSKNRGLPVVSCMVAVTSDHRIGAWVTVTRVKTGHTERCRITDVCRPRDCPALARRGIVAELSWPAASRLCQLRYVNQEPPRACVVSVSR